jgi:hypothetical protein
MIKISIVTLSLLLCSGMATAQSCPETVAGESMARMIGEAGGAEKLHEMATSQVKEIDKFLAEAGQLRGQGVAEQEINNMIQEATAARQPNEDIAKAALCYMGR